MIPYLWGRYKRRGQRLLGPQMAATQSDPHPSQLDKGCPSQGATDLNVTLAIVASLIALQLAEVPRAHQPHRLPQFHEGFLWRDTCFGGLQSRWPESLGSQLLAPKWSQHLQPSDCVGPAYNRPATASTRHLLQLRPLHPTECMAN